MSTPHFSWALTVGRERKLKAVQRLVLCVLAERANGSLECWPSLSCLANDTGLSPRTIWQVVHDLSDETKGTPLLRLEARGREMHYFILRSGGPSQSLRGSPSQQVRESPPPSSQQLRRSAPRPSQSTTDDPRNSPQMTYATVANESLKRNPSRESLKVGRARQAPLSEDWQPDETGLAFARQRGVDIESEVQKFVAHHLARGNRMVSWHHAWRTWCMNAVKFGTASGKPSDERYTRGTNGTLWPAMSGCP